MSSARSLRDGCPSSGAELRRILCPFARADIGPKHAGSQVADASVAALGSSAAEHHAGAAKPAAQRESDQAVARRVPEADAATRLAAYSAQAELAASQPIKSRAIICAI